PQPAEIVGACLRQRPAVGREGHGVSGRALPRWDDHRRPHRAGQGLAERDLGGSPRRGVLPAQPAGSQLPHSHALLAEIQGQRAAVGRAGPAGRGGRGGGAGPGGGPPAVTSHTRSFSSMSRAARRRLSAENTSVPQIARPGSTTIGMEAGGSILPTSSPPGGPSEVRSVPVATSYNRTAAPDPPRAASVLPSGAKVIDTKWSGCMSSARSSLPVRPSRKERVCFSGSQAAIVLPSGDRTNWRVPAAPRPAPAGFPVAASHSRSAPSAPLDAIVLPSRA